MAPPARNRKTASRKDLRREVRHHKSSESTADAAPRPSPAHQAWAPGGYTAFKVLLSARLCASVWNNIQDCDETFNYWEPTHYLLYGRGLQTWEYAPQYALRSYTYLLLHALPAYLYAALLQSNRLLVFYFLRCLLGLLCAATEVYFYRGVCLAYGANIGRLTLAFLSLSAGMFIAGSAYLPSSFGMCMTMLAAGAWLRRCYPLAIFGTALGALLGWPFTALLGAPIAWDVVVRQKKLWMFVKWSAISLFVLVGPMTKIDSDIYGKLVSAPFNIVRYNVFSSSGANLYGTEPASFYIINGVLNFNVALPLAAAALPLIALVSLTQPRSPACVSSPPVPLYLCLLPLALWTAVFGAQAHKEERFLFPAYPYLGLAAAAAVDHLQLLLHHILLPGRDHLQRTGWFALAVLAAFASLSLSRVVGQYRGYHAPFDTFMELNRLSVESMPAALPADVSPVTVCVGREWHRFPSSFFLPGLDWRLGFLASEFRGQLPQYYADSKNATQLVRDHFNDRNLEEPINRYVNESECHFLVDLDLAVSAREPAYSRQKNLWSVLHSTPFLSAAGSNRLLRAFYVPWLTERHCSYTSYNLLVNNQWRHKLLNEFAEDGGGPGRR